MTNFEEAHKRVMAKQGEAFQHSSEDYDEHILLCSNCFRDEGLKLDAIKIGIQKHQRCPNCNTEDGRKLTKALIHKLCYRFFVRGTIFKCNYGGSPLIQFNEHHFNQSDVEVSSWLLDDVKLIGQAGKIGLFHYGPRLWMVGEVEPLKSLQNVKEREQVIDDILKKYPVRELSAENYFYRLRKAPQVPYDSSEYDSAPDNCLGKNRFDDSDFPVLYGSPDLELCVHECRITVEDEIYVGKLVPNANLKVLDLSAVIEEDVTEFESLDIAVHFLFLAGDYSYPICRQIAKRAKAQGFDGIIYPSYFSYFRTGAIPFDTVYGMSIRKLAPLKEYAQSQNIPNLALFGRPVKDQKVTVACINKVIVNRIEYDLTFGPANI